MGSTSDPDGATREGPTLSHGSSRRHHGASPRHRAQRCGGAGAATIRGDALALRPGPRSLDRLDRSTARLEELVNGPYQRGSPGASSSSLGLRLFIVCEIVRAQAGKVEVSSTREHGTTFAVRLPRTPPASPVEDVPWTGVALGS